MASDRELDELDQLFMQLARQVWSAVREKGVGGLSLIQLSMLKCLSTGQTRAHDLSTRLSVSPAAITKIVDNLRERGLITRTRSLEDRRSAVLAITPAGREGLERSRRMRNRTLRTLLVTLSPEDIVVLKRFLRRSVEILPGAWQD